MYLWCSCDVLGVCTMAKSACYLYTFTSVRPTEHISAVPTGHIRVKCNYGTCMKICRENPVRLKSGKNIGKFVSRRKWVLFLPVKINRHKNVFFEWKGIRMLEQPRKYIYYTNAPCCSVIYACLSCYQWFFRAKLTAYTSGYYVVCVENLPSLHNNGKVLILKHSVSV